MKHKRLLPLIVATATAAGSMGLVATMASTASASGSVHLTYALWDANEEIGYKQSIAVFEKNHPNITVSVEQIPYSAYQTKLQEEFASGSGPDIFWINTPWLSTWIKDGFLVNLAPDIQKANINMKQYIPSLVALHTYKGAIYGLPKDWDTIGIYYNENYMKAHGLTPPTNWTWNPTNGGTFLKFLEEATVDTSGNNATSPKFDSSKIATYGMEMDNAFQTGFGSFWQMDGCHVIPAAWASSTSFNTPACYQTTQFIRNLMYKYHVLVPGSELGANGESPSGQDLNLFAAGKIAMYLEGDWNTSPAWKAIGTKFKIGVVPLPAGPDGRWSVFNGLIDGVNKNTPNFQATWQLEQWLGSAASQKIMGQGGYIWPAIPSLDSLFVKAWAAKGIPMTPFSEEAVGNVVDWPNTPGMNQALTDMGTAMGPIWLSGGSLSNTESALKSAYAAANHDLQAAGA
jgi:multiple sugar transport system substrate-binding protein